MDSKNTINYTEEISKTLLRQTESKIWNQKLAPAKYLLRLFGAGLGISAILIAPGMARLTRSFLINSDRENWKKFNIPYLKRHLKRLESQKLIEKTTENGEKVIKITENGRRKILKFALEEIEIEKPKIWDGSWYLISYDIPAYMQSVRTYFRYYLLKWNFYPLHESVYLHAFPCENEINFLKEYYNLGKYVRIFTVSKIENDLEFRRFFDLAEPF